MALPPVVDGLTETAESPAALLGQLAGRGGGSARADVGQALEALRRAAAADPQLAERVAKAIAVIMGTDDEDTERAVEPPKMGPKFGGNTFQTPV